jgi:hypothetical protein
MCVRHSFVPLRLGGASSFYRPRGGDLQLRHMKCSVASWHTVLVI